MGLPTPPSPVVLIVAVITRHAAALDWAGQRMTEHWGPIALESPIFDFRETDYYLG
ncbi:MAG: DUF4416 family protein, partial [Planctomycetaceae bacterium]|nr:DUF4416 family protein [Planctomycetaceae bacterium]